MTNEEKLLQVISIIYAKSEELEADIAAHAANRLARDKLSQRLAGIRLPARRVLEEFGIELPKARR